MRLKIKSIRDKLILAFTIFLIVNLFIILAVFYNIRRKDSIEKSLSSIKEIELNTQIVNKLERDFFNDVAVDTSFHSQIRYIPNKKDNTGIEKITPVLKERRTALNNISKNLKDLRNVTVVNSKSVVNYIDSLDKIYKHYDQTFQQTMELIELRGFKDYGLEGDMRKHIHDIENSPYPFDMTKMLMIRRHEKDFMLRKDSVYITKLKKTVKELTNDIKSKNNSVSGKADLLQHLAKYEQAFFDLATYEDQIGFSNTSGKRKILQDDTDKIKRLVMSMDKEINEKASTAITQINLSLFGIVLLSVSLVIGLGYYITLILSRPIAKLSESINNVIQSRFQKGVHVQQINTQDEIGLLSKDFAYMLERVQDSIHEIRDKSDKLERKQKLIVDSIRYAKQIQEAILPEEDDMSMLFEEYFVIYYPRDRVSGDFYWCRQKGEKTYLAVIDCTGHGVPGAFMSMIGNTLLNQIIAENQIDDPAFILETLHIEVMMALHQEKRMLDDGMDVCMVMIENNGGDSKKITFTGAKRSLYLGSGGKVFEIKGDHRSIGGATRKNKAFKPFNNKVVDIPKGSYLYLSTDGLVDQQSRYKNKFGTKKFIETLQVMQTQPTEEQRRILATELKNHKSGVKQRDDITVVGVRV